MALGERLSVVGAGEGQVGDISPFDELPFEEGHCHAPIYLSTVDMYVGGRDDDDIYLYTGAAMAGIGRWWGDLKRRWEKNPDDKKAELQKEIEREVRGPRLQLMAEKQGLIGNRQKEISLYLEAIDAFHRADAHRPSMMHINAIYETSIKVGDILFSVGEFEKAFNMYSKAYSTLERIRDEAPDFFSRNAPNTVFKLTHAAKPALGCEFETNIKNGLSAIEYGQFQMAERFFSQALQARRRAAGYGIKFASLPSFTAAERLEELIRTSETTLSKATPAIRFIFCAMAYELLGKPAEAEIEYATAANAFLDAAQKAVQNGDANAAERAATGAKAIAARKVTKEGLVNEDLIRKTFEDIKRLKGKPTVATGTAAGDAETQLGKLKQEVDGELQRGNGARSFGSAPTLPAVEAANTDPLSGESPAAKLARQEALGIVEEAGPTEVELALGELAGGRERPEVRASEKFRGEILEGTKEGVRRAEKAVERERKPK